MSDRTTIDTIKNRLDIVSIIQEYVPNLKHSGRNFFGLCPFHNEKSPSFSVNQEIQIYKCFGCGESGDVIKFLEKIEGLDFPAALELAARKAGIELPKNKVSARNINSEREEIIKANTLAAEYYNYLLTKHPSGKRGKDYADKRKLNNKSINDFKIGYAPKGFNNLKKFLIARKFDEKKLVKWSLLVEKNGRVYDKFRDRLMFPIHNHMGEIIGFSGRVINNEDIPKYLNSSDTEAYHKSMVVYGLFQAKDAIRKKKFVVMVEGNVDVPMAHQFELENIVAPMGTALTENQLKLIKRYAETIYFAFDGDLAGEKALMRGFELCENLGISTKALDLGEYKDLDELLNSEPTKLEEIITDAKPVIESLIHRIASKTDMSSAKGKSNLVNILSPYIQKVSDKVEQTHYVQLLATLTQVDESTIWNTLREPKTANQISFGNNSKEITPAKQPTNLKKDINSKSEYLVAMLMQHEFLRNNEVDFETVDSDGRLGYVYNIYIHSKNAKEALDQLEDEEKHYLEKLLMINLGEFESDNELQHYFEQLYKEIKYKFYRKQISNLRQQIAQLEAADQPYEDLLTKLNNYKKKLR